MVTVRAENFTALTLTLAHTGIVTLTLTVFSFYYLATLYLRSEGFSLPLHSGTALTRFPPERDGLR